MECYSVMKKNEIMSFTAIWMDPQMVILSEVRQKKTSIIWYHLFSESKIWHNWTYLWKRNRLTDIDNILVVAKGGCRVGMDLEISISRCKLLYTEWINKKVLLYSTGNSIQYPVKNHNGKEYENDHFAVEQKLTQHWKSTIHQNF